MPVRFLDRREIKSEARSLLKSARVSPLKMTLLYLAITLALDLASNAASFYLQLSTLKMPLRLTFLSILVSLISIVLSAGFTCYTLGVYRGEEMPYESLLDGFAFAGKAIGLSFVTGLFVFLWSMLFILPGIVAAYRYSFAMLELCRDPELKIMVALERSKERTNGYKLQLFSLQCSFIGWFALEAVAISLLEGAIGASEWHSLADVIFSTLATAVGAGAVNFYLLPYLNFATCGFYLRAIGEPPAFAQVVDTPTGPEF